MCELFALCFNQPVNTQISFKGFRKHGISNPHGWGFAFYPDKSAVVFKEPFRGDTSELAEFIQNYRQIQSNIFLSHVRYSSGTAIAYCNTHPFLRELFGKPYVFAHNGTLSNYKQIFKSQFYQPIGETDSEYAFCWIMDQIRIKNLRTTLWSIENFE